jgi:hypothetical protein
MVKKFFLEFRLTSNPEIPEYRDLAFCLRIPTQDSIIGRWPMKGGGGGSGATNYS